MLRRVIIMENKEEVMKYGINNRMVLIVTLSSFALSGCISKYEVKNAPVASNQFSQSISKTWKKKESSWKRASKPWKSVKSTKVDVECVNCYASDSVLASNETEVESYEENNIKITYDYSGAPSELMGEVYEVSPHIASNENYRNGMYDYNDAYASNTYLTRR